MKVSIRTISKVTGFSPATVSNALNHKPGVSPKTAAQIVRVAGEMGYQPQSRIERINFVVARKTGSILDEGEFHPAVMDGIERAARREGMPTRYVTVDLETPTAQDQIEELCRDKSSGLILLGTELKEEDYRPFYDCEAPLVIVDGFCFHKPIESIVISNESSSYTAVHYLISMGHTKIGYITAGDIIQNFPLRRRGCEHALTEAGLSLDEKYVMHVGTKLSTAYSDAKEWLSHDPDLPTAFFADNDILASGAMRAFLERGIRVPEEVSFIGFDDLPLARLTLPSLTTIHIHKHDIGSMAVQKLLCQVRNPQGYTCVTHISSDFVIRDSVARV
ncbi:LacI family DNA-binding transcriptional regulator [Parafannyhessea umbonata]|uniref:LacI family DNA-binding transcriptional regulator n=1 Tax=Parafannyhessea umbonata TaxID=604330 RepID=UPI002A8353AF|nr:LacI family DNA-binding transcriptional regulator [Parafannyhessea umbonata]MDY4014543.1 LacI family DNA-binding transcriptional regulator [Parafannyhessea umbonata]